MGKGSAGFPAVACDDPAVQLPDGSFYNVNRSFNFCAGPAMLDTAVMRSMATDFLSFQGSGVSLIEMSQRDTKGPVQTMFSDAVNNIRRLLSVPDDYEILLFQVSYTTCPQTVACTCSEAD
jgi:phosphoserine aminotransferase